MISAWYETPLFLNTLYAVGGVVIGILAAIITYKLFNRITHFNIPGELEKVQIQRLAGHYLYGTAMGMPATTATAEDGNSAGK